MEKFNIIKFKNQGFCYGVKRAINIAKDAALNPNIKKPIYLLGNIVHNHHIEEALEKIGIITINGTNRLDMLDEVPNNSTLIFSAHGVSDKVKQKALSKHLFIIDATCPYVEATFNLVSKKVESGAEILFIGKPNHPETEAVLELSNHVHLYNEEQLELKSSNIMIAHQTTMSKYDINNIYNNLKERFPNISVLDMICRVTESRQNEISLLKDNILPDSLIIIIGDKSSNNSTKLYEMAKRTAPSVFIDSIAELDLNFVKKFKNIYIGSGTSTPDAVIDEVENTLYNINQINDNYVKSSVNAIDAIK